MPASKTDSKAGGKMSKKKLAELKKKEDEEKLKREEEEKKRKEEEEERKRKEEEERKCIEEEKRREEEKQRLEQERILAQDGFQLRKQLLLKRQDEMDQKEEWEKFKECSNLPDATSESAINSYVSNWRNDPNFDVSKRNIEEDFDECEIAAQLLKKIEELLLQTPRDNKQQIMMHKKNLEQVSNAMYETLSDISVHLFNNYEKFIDTTSQQFHKEKNSLSFGLWANINQGNVKSIHFDNLQVSVDVVLDNIAFNRSSFRAFTFDFDYLSSLSASGNMFQPIGGLVFIEFLEVPELSWEIGGWKIRKITELSKKLTIKPYEKKNTQTGKNETPPTKVSFLVSKNIVQRKDIPEVAWWDKKKRKWSTKGIGGTEFNDKTRIISFLTTSLNTAFGVVQSKVFDVPYHSWYICPAADFGKNALLLHITPRQQFTTSASIPDICILVFDTKCKLVSPKLDELSELNNKGFGPLELVKRMASCGINLMIEDECAKETELEPKSKQLEQKAYRDLSLMSNYVCVASSKWNKVSECGDNSCVFRVSKRTHSLENYAINPNIASEPAENHGIAITIDLEKQDEWQSILFETEKCTAIAVDENGNDFSNQAAAGCVSHLDLLTTLKHLHPEDKETIEDTVAEGDMLTTKTLQNLLEIVRLISWG